ncbi:MAG TPA: hypothetical protein VFR68_06040 [Candidatus Dormibacteraeota bacterium]|nr:hypothetical protein [Candidatus Dormibacteraeota bacterium]
MSVDELAHAKVALTLAVNSAPNFRGRVARRRLPTEALARELVAMGLL